MNQDQPLQRVMLIDDEVFDQEMYRRILTRSNLVEDTVTFSLAADALAYLQDDTAPLVDLILLDINMPAMNGFEFLNEAQHYLGQKHQIPVVMMLTTSLSPDDRERAEQNPFVTSFMNKPLQPGAVPDLVNLVAQAKNATPGWDRKSGISDAAPPH